MSNLEIGLCMCPCKGAFVIILSLFVWVAEFLKRRERFGTFSEPAAPSQAADPTGSSGIKVGAALKYLENRAKIAKRGISESLGCSLQTICLANSSTAGI